MALEVAWRLMFRVNNRAAADHCLARVLEHMPAIVTHPPKPYWKIPELWESSLRTPIASPANEGVFLLLRTASRLGSPWTIAGPLLAGDRISHFSGEFNAPPGRPHIAGLAWAHFDVGEFPAVAHVNPSVNTH
ncbi:MAG: hypothetical protein NTW19_13760 [Planctomycetota bacterium]|nr:hypothetical protein [Planctomycetota bacterium]